MRSGTISLSSALTLALLAAQAIAPSFALTIAEINGNKFISPYRDQAVTNVTGVVLAKGPNGIWLRSDAPDSDPATSEAIYVFSSTVGANLAVGDLIALNGRVMEYRSTAAYLYLTEITSPTNVRKVSSGNPATPLVIGVDTPIPPSEQYTSLDGGDVFALPNGVSLVSTANPTLDPSKYGLDFWESLNGELVTVRNPTALNRPNSFGDTWVAGGEWAVTGRNARGGLTMTDKDANPEAIIVGTPLDGSSNPTGTKLGDGLGDITGIVTYAFGFYRILPLSAITITDPKPYDPKATSLTTTGDCRGVTVGVFNVENLCPTSPHLPAVAAQLVEALKTPDLVFLQEVQDDSCATNNGVVAANATFAALAGAVEALSGVAYDFVDVSPVNNADGGAPGGNIRVSYLYRPEVLRLVDPNPGSSTDANEVLPGPALKFNPGRIDPANAAWSNSRKPLVAAWKPIKGGKVFFTVNVHFSSKGGSSSLHGDPRPPNNGAIDARMLQSQVTGDFIAQILAQDPNARVIAAGDFNEFTFVSPITTFLNTSGLLDLDEVAGIPVLERYSYVFDMNTQQLDHTFVSSALQGKSEFEHLHFNSWQNTAEMVSDHDPSVAKFNLCACG